MSTNRSSIDDFAIVRPPLNLDKGWAIPGMGKRLTVDEGWVAVMVEGGAYAGLLHAGTHSLNKFRYGKDLKAIKVDIREQNMTVSTSREFTIANPVPVTINLDLSVEYRVTDARRIALEAKTPLTNLFDRVLQAIRGAVVHASHEEIRTQGEGIAQTALQRLNAMRLKETIGLEVFNVFVTSIKALDTDQDVLAKQQLEEFQTVRGGLLDQQMLSNSQITWEWLLMHRPEVAQQMIQEHGANARALIEKGAVDPSSFLSNPTGNLQSGTPPNNLLTPFGAPHTPGNQQAQQQLPTVSTSGSSTPQGLPAPSAQPDIHQRMRDEINMLQQLPGAAIETRAGTDAQGVPDGSYALRVVVPRNAGGQIVFFFGCAPNYPSTAPTVDVEVDGQEVAFDSGVLRRWIGQYLVEIVREAKQKFG